MKKENLKAIEYIQNEFSKAKKAGIDLAVSAETLERLGIDTSNETIELRNLILKQNIFFSNVVYPILRQC